SDSARKVAAFEQVEMPVDARITVYDNADLFAPVASGSADYTAMVVVPCSVGTVGRVASGVSQTLIERAADVMLKERRKLIFVVRETPLSLIHLRNLTTLAECGAIILPAAPSFYAMPQSIEALCMTIVERIIMQLGISAPHYEWGK
ncbi:MAG: UbiX family flavin prenyltransferase, partial [Alistipes sp.]